MKKKSLIYPLLLTTNIACTSNTPKEGSDFFYSDLSSCGDNFECVEKVAKNNVHNPNFDQKIEGHFEDVITPMTLNNILVLQGLNLAEGTITIGYGVKCSVSFSAETLPMNKVGVNFVADLTILVD